MTLYYLDVREGDWSSYRLAGRHALTLPSVACDHCGSVWSSLGVSYPTCDITALRDLDRDPDSPVPIGEFLELAGRLRLLLPSGAPIQPGTSLGPFTG